MRSAGNRTRDQAARRIFTTCQDLTSWHFSTCQEVVLTCYKYSITCQDDLLTVDNAQSHVTAFRPISEAARSWSDDNRQCSLSALTTESRYSRLQDHPQSTAADAGRWPGMSHFSSLPVTDTKIYYMVTETYVLTILHRVIMWKWYRWDPVLANQCPNHYSTTLQRQNNIQFGVSC